MKFIGTILLGIIVLFVVGYLISAFGEAILGLLVIALIVGFVFRLLNR